MGVVSASENVTADDTITTSDVTGDSIEEAPVDEVMGESGDSQPLELEPEDFNYAAKSSINLNDVDKEVFNCTLPQDGYINYYVDGNKVDSKYGNSSDIIKINISQLQISQPNTYHVKFEYETQNADLKLNITEYNLTVTDVVHDDKYVFIPYTYVDYSYHTAMVAYIYEEDYINGTVSVYIDGDLRLSKVISDNAMLNKFNITVDDLNLYRNISGEHTVKVVYMKNGVEKHEVEKLVQFEIEGEQFVYISSKVNIFFHDFHVTSIDDYYMNGTVYVYIDGDLKFTKNVSSDDYLFYISVDDLKLYNSAIGNHTIKTVYMNNGAVVDEDEKSVEFYVGPGFSNYYSFAPNEKENLVITHPVKSFTGSATLYNTEYVGGEYVKGTVVGSAKFTDGVATIPFGSLAEEFYIFLLNITGESSEYTVNVYVRENTPGLSANISASEITVGNNVVVTFKGNRPDGKVYFIVDEKQYASVPLTTDTISQAITGLSVGTHKIKVYFDRGDFYSNTFYVTVKKDVVKLTLKKVKVKRSAKKLVLQATLKINGKAVKGKVIKFKFKGKTYKAKTNKKGVAKVTIKKKILKKLKVGKKVKYQATFGKITKKLTVKVKK